MRCTKHWLIWLLAAGLVAATSVRLLAEQAPPAEGNEAQLLAVLQSDAPLFDKAKACQRLATIGTKQSVPVLAALLSNEQLSHYARYGLEPIPDPAVDEALRASLSQLKGGLLVGVINSIGMRRARGAIADLKGLMGDSDPAVAAAAASALGRIATPEAVQILRGALDGPASLRPAAADACLTAADTWLGDGRKDEAAAIYDALRQADLPKHLSIAALYGALRARGSAGVPLLAECLGSEDKAVFQVGLRMAQELPGREVTEALVAELSKPVPGPEAPPKVLAITKAEYGAQDTWVDVTDQLAAAVTGGGVSVRAGNGLAGDPIPGVVKQLRVEYTLGGEKHTATVPENESFEIQGDMVRHPRQSLLINVLAERGDRGALPVVLEAAKSGPWDIRVSAVRALARLGDAASVPVLLGIAAGAQGELAAAAHDSLAALPGKDVDAALLTALSQSEGGKRLVVIDLVGRRGIAQAVPTLLKLANSDDQPTSLAAVRALGSTIGLEGLPTLIDRLIAPQAPELAPVAKEALRKACLRVPDRDACAALLIDRMAAAPTTAKVDLLDLLGVVGGAKALKGVSAAARRESQEVQDAATRVLGEWMSAEAAPVLLELATAGNDAFRIRCLRGYIRIARQLDVAADERIAMCQKAMEAAQRDDERKLVFEVLRRNPSVETLSMATSYLGTPGLQGTAGETATAIAQEIVAAHPSEVAEAMRQVLKKTESAELAGQAKKLLRRAERR
jgi:HEAT repeat protein